MTGELRLLDRRLAWVAAALAISIAGAVVVQTPRYALDLTLAMAAITLFAWRPYVGLLVAVALGFKDSPLAEIMTLFGGGVVLLVRGVVPRGAVIWLPWLALVLFAVWRLPVHPTPVEGAQPPYLTLPSLGQPYLPTPSAALLAWWRLASLLVVFLLGAWLVTDLTRLRRLAAATLVGAAVPVVIGLKQLATGQFTVRDGYRAVEGPFAFPNYFAFYLMGVLLIGLVALLDVRSLRWRVALGVLLAGAATCLLFTYTRGAWVGFSIGFVVIGVLAHRRLLLLGAVLLAAASFAFPHQVSRVQQRFGDLSSRSASSSTNSLSWRTGQWSQMVHFGLDAPLAGHGFGSYPRLTVRQFGTEGHRYATVVTPALGSASPRGFTAHNDYLRMLVELGFPGLVLWAATLLGLMAAMLSAARIPGVRPYAVATAALILAIAVTSAADNLMGYTAALLVAVSLAGGVVGVAGRSRQRLRQA